MKRKNIINKINILSRLFTVHCSLFTLGCSLFTAHGQSLQQLGSSYYAYPEPTEIIATETPEGYKPFYISHYGRHGSRWLTSDDRYEALLLPFDSLTLTPLGQEVKAKLQRIVEDGIGRAGHLSPIGERQHKGIAKRMMQRWPEVFKDSTQIRAQSSTKMRCAMSMAAFCEALKEENPSLQITRTAYDRDMVRMAYETPEAKAFKDSLENSQGYLQFVAETVDPTRLMGSLFTNPQSMTLEQQLKLMTELYWTAQDMQNIELDEDLYYLFTPAEIEAIWETINARMYMCNADSEPAKGRTVQCAAPLLESIKTDLLSAIEKDSPTVDLRFGHDTHLMRLLGLMGFFPSGISDYKDVKGNWRDYEISPMAANLQIVFYRPIQKDSCPILFQILLNERPLTPLSNLNLTFPENLQVQTFPVSQK